jgi:hypothetical protein
VCVFYAAVHITYGFLGRVQVAFKSDSETLSPLPGGTGGWGDGGASGDAAGTAYTCTEGLQQEVQSGHEDIVLLDLVAWR